MYLFQQFPLTKKVKIKFFAELFACDLCLGVWLYFVLASFLHFVIFSDIFGYIPLVSEIITASVTSFIVHLVSLGWKSKFEIFQVN